ncbi:MAG: hypothetical protein AB1644_07600 [Candidatus Zixiibacteriota bacterium]
MGPETPSLPLTFNLTKWHGYGLAGIYLLYAGVKIILSFLDRTYADMGQSFLFLIVGIILISVVFAYRDLKAWGWYGLVVMNAVVILLSLFGLSHYEYIVMMVLSLASLALLFAAPTKRFVFKSR